MPLERKANCIAPGAESLILPLAAERILELSLQDAFQQHLRLQGYENISKASQDKPTKHTYWLIPVVLDILREFPQLLQKHQKAHRLFRIHPREERMTLLGALCCVLGEASSSEKSLSHAFLAEFEQLLRLLQTLTPNASAHKLQNLGKTPLHLACANPCMDSAMMLRTIVEICYYAEKDSTADHNPLDAVDTHGWTPLCHLLHSRPDDVRTIRYLLHLQQQEDEGCKNNNKEDQEEHPVEPTSLVGGVPSVKNCWTPMHAAVYAGAPVHVLDLIQSHFPESAHSWACPHRKRASRGGGRMHISAASCTTPLHVACMMMGPRRPSQHQALLLLPSQRSSSGQRANNFADDEDIRRIQVVEWLLQQSTVRSLVSRCDSWGTSPLEYAVQQGSLPIVQKLLEILENDNAILADETPFVLPSLSRTGESILHLAVRNGHVNIVQWLCDFYPQLASRPSCCQGRIRHHSRAEEDGCLPLHVACSRWSKTEATTMSTWSALIRAYPQALNKTNARGQIPGRIVACRIGWEAAKKFDTLVNQLEGQDGASLENQQRR